MLRTHLLSPQNEAAAVERLAAQIRTMWPGIEADDRARIDLLVGVRKTTDVDLLVALDAEDGLAIPANGASPGATVYAALIAVEIKQLDASMFEAVGNQLFAIYGRARKGRSVADQARDAAYGIKTFAAESGFPHLYVSAVGWLTEVDDLQLDGIDPIVVGRRGWAAVLGAAVAQDRQIGSFAAHVRSGVIAVRDRLLRQRAFSPLDKRKTERVARDAIARELVREIAPHAGSKAIRLYGNGGSGKTTALVLLATQLAVTRQARVLILTFHHALCGDIRHALRNVPDAAHLLGDSICVETVATFLLSLITAAGDDVPMRDGAIDYDAAEAAYAKLARTLGPDAVENRAMFVAENARRFEWDHVLVDESQDCSDGERDLLLAVYGADRLVLADGLTQLIRRSTSCNWLRDVSKSERIERELGDSLRMQRNVATFANAVAGAVGFPTWHLAPRTELAGGRVVILEGPLDDPLALVRAIDVAATRGDARRIDNLICVPHSELGFDADGMRRANLARALLDSGERVWDGTNAATRMTEPSDVETWRIVQYDSCRGLEGWATLLLALDDLYANKLKHPTSGTADRPVDPHVAAKRWLLMPLTRGIHLLVVHVRDAASPVAQMLHEAVSTLPRDAVERYSACDGFRSI